MALPPSRRSDLLDIENTVLNQRVESLFTGGLVLLSVALVASLASLIVGGWRSPGSRATADEVVAALRVGCLPPGDDGLLPR